MYCSSAALQFYNFHLLSGYDGLFVLRYMNDNGLPPNVIKRGNQLISLTYSRLGLTFRDTLNFVPCMLEQFPKLVGVVDESKGEFPHKANKPENWDKVIAFPDVSKFYVHKKNERQMADFKSWHDEARLENNGRVDFRKMIVSYCSQDVTLLRKCALKFREAFHAGAQMDCYAKSCTIASACRQFLLTFCMVPETIAVISAHGYDTNRKTSFEATQYFEYLNSQPEYNGALMHGRIQKEEKVGKYFVDAVFERNDGKKEAHEYNGYVIHYSCVTNIF